MSMGKHPTNGIDRQIFVSHAKAVIHSIFEYTTLQGRAFNLSSAALCFFHKE